MPNTTKQALEESLKHMLLKKPLDKITIRDITEDCGISRMAFYYHFKDIYDLVEWACIEDASKALQGKKTYETWQEGLLQIFEAVLENKPFILNAYRCISREQMERFLYQLTYGLIRGVVEEQSRGTAVSEEDKSFIAEFYKYSFVGGHAGLDPPGNDRRSPGVDGKDQRRHAGQYRQRHPKFFGNRIRAALQSGPDD